MIYDLYWLMKHATDAQKEVAKGVWVPARPERFYGLEAWLDRLWDALAVLSGRADAFRWPGGQ